MLQMGEDYGKGQAGRSERFIWAWLFGEVGEDLHRQAGSVHWSEEPSKVPELEVVILE